MKRIPKPTAHGRKAEQSLKRAVATFIEESRRLGLPVAVMYNGKAVTVSVEEAIRLARAEVRPITSPVGGRSRVPGPAARARTHRSS